MLPLMLSKIGTKQSVKKIIGKDDTKRFLKSLGIIEGSEVTIISQIHGNIIIKVKETSIAINQSVANRIMI
ncbi:FeoA family protein [Lachnospiraceae bacterium 46-61]